MQGEQLIERINQLKGEKNAVMLVHNYQSPEIYSVADYIGDSLGLARNAAETDKDVIVFCGVHFMAETAKILSPDKTVLLPAYNAGCPMADMVTPEKIDELKEQYPAAAVACYVNTTAAVKAASDVCVTSSNAVDVINSLEQDQVIFVPDKNLGAYVQQFTGKQIILYDGKMAPYVGFCYVHQKFTADELIAAKAKFDDVAVVVHPECRPEVTDLADHVCSTSAMIDFAKETSAKNILVGTEVGMIERLKMEVPDKNFYSAGNPRTCVNMKRNNLQLVYDALINNQHQVEVPLQIAKKARLSLERMLVV